MTSELETLFPTGVQVELQGKQFNIRPFNFGQFPKVIKAITKASATAQELKVTDGKITPEAALTILSESGEDLIVLLAEMLEVEKSFIEKLPMDEAVVLISAFFEVNADFFTKRVLPLIVKAMH
jgi:hypothetical protein